MPGSLKEIQPLIIIVTIVILFLLITLILFTLAYQSRKNRYLNEKQQLQSNFQQALLQTQLEIQEQTLKNISQEIHDNVGQVLSLAKLNLNTMDINKTEQLQGKIDNTLTQVSKAINDLRDLSKSFNTDGIIAMGLIRAIAAELDMINKAETHKAVFKVTGNSIRLEPQKELILFRIVQEALHNIIKHAKAGTVQVFADYTNSQLELQVRDDGKGFDLTPLNHENENGYGLGIRNMHNRAKLIGADFTMTSIPGNGTVVKIVLPFPPNQSSSHENG